MSKKYLKMHKNWLVSENYEWVLANKFYFARQLAHAPTQNEKSDFLGAFDLKRLFADAQ